MALDASAPWHRESYDRFLNERLPELLAARLPLVGYSVASEGRYDVHVTVTLAFGAREVTTVYAGVPRPDEEGVFEIEGIRRVVLPIADTVDLAAAEVRSVGEQLGDLVAARLGEAPTDLPWDEALVRTWLPLDTWVRDFIRHTGQTLQRGNWLERHAHLRRVRVRVEDEVITPGHFGRVCPIEAPEGPNLGRLVTVAVGAEIRDSRLTLTDPRPEAALGVTASMIPFLEQSDPNRLLMGANMMRQWLVPPDPEPALVQTGNEPDAADFWCGRNLLTAYISWGVETFEDAIVISESCARRLSYPRAIEPGDKLSNRHGSKGVVSRILPDAEMPRLQDGTPVDLIFHFLGLPSRLNFGQVREALMGRIARAEGRTAVVPPFGAPGADELRRRLAAAGLPEAGMETLRIGHPQGQPLRQPSMAGWVYWGRLHHMAREKLSVSVAGPRAQRLGEAEYVALRDAGAIENIREQFNTRAAEREDAGTLAVRLAEGSVEQAGPPTPQFAELARRLAAGGVRVALDEGRLTFDLAEPTGAGLALAATVPHPWARERSLQNVGAMPEMPEYRALADSNARLERMQAGQAPESLVRGAVADLVARAREFFDALLTPAHLRPAASVLFIGRAVIAPGADLRLDQVGLAEEIAWTLFGPLVAREIGDAAAVAERVDAAVEALDALMARTWVLIYRPGFFGNGLNAAPAPFLAFHPVRVPEPVIRLHPLACNLMDSDFDGDELTVLLPVTTAAQQEAGERLSIAGRLARDPGLLPYLCPIQEPVWGLASLGLTPEGEREIRGILGTETATLGRPLGRSALVAVMRDLLQRIEVDRALAVLEQLFRRGCDIIRESGASVSPFLGSSMALPVPPEGDDPEAWARYADELDERILSRTDYENPDLGPQILALKSGARGTPKQLRWHLGAHEVADLSGRPVGIRRGYCEGLTPDELRAHVIGTWKGLSKWYDEWEQTLDSLRRSGGARGYHVLARAMRAQHPGIVFAHAAATGEADPLTDLDSRLFVGLKEPG